MPEPSELAKLIALNCFTLASQSFCRDMCIKNMAEYLEKELEIVREKTRDEEGKNL